MKEEIFIANSHMIKWKTEKIRLEKFFNINESY